MNLTASQLRTIVTSFLKNHKGVLSLGLFLEPIEIVGTKSSIRLEALIDTGAEGNYIRGQTKFILLNDIDYDAMIGVKVMQTMGMDINMNLSENTDQLTCPLRAPS